ncbi:hypothetical protein M427DRAFT_457059 [Gonapodya prolifera JEL478]|uniref:RNA-dependent RNA polymerase n=1 Tax=Gonapodya prolifera (strain JEL478) TaxID=1344416 RepID=A0A139A2U0_GONPJ|nr:hypothetical protein M427DRAFT_457059 [Gonapodya prolifera JEL478]|eukprot:KXS11071.1 hypothetical protein M427DRAFT_457059 [Gonapodya prolifera JEL478]
MPPLPRNLSQLTGKFLARLDLWGSSTDAVQLPPDIAIVYDLDDVHPAGNPGEAMTDGAGLVSRRVMEHVCSALGRTGSLPNAMQIRYLGFKGLLVMDRTDELGEVGRTRREELNGRTPDIAFRKSMHKYVSPPEELSQPGTLEVVALTHVSLANLNQQLVNVLECGGVPEEPFRNLVAKATETLIDTFLQPNMIPNAIQALMTQPVSAGLSGFSRLAHNLCAGFDAKEPYIRSKLVDHIQWKLSPMWTSAHIPIQEAGMYTIVPAPKGTLKEGEILVQVPGFTNALAGREVVILRNPAVLPTDGQKLRVADIRDYPQLAGYDDVCMMSVEGDVREASRIAGGDYDGDRAVVIWLKEIVDSFKCQRDVPKTPDDVEESFSQSKEVVKDLVKDHTGEQYGRPLLARGVLEWSTATNAKVGWYTMLWAAAVDKWGMDSPSALRFAHIAARLLDARKNGEFLNSEVEKMHKDFFLKHHKGQPPVWWKTGSSKAKQVAATQPKYARFLHELAAGSDQLLQERVAGLSKATQCPEIIEYFDRDDALFGSDKHWAHDMRLVRDSIFATELPLWAGYWKEELNAKLGPIPTSSAQAAAPENPDVENELTVLKGLTGRDAVMARFRQLFETSPADQELHSLALRGTNGRDRLLKLKAALIYKHSRSSYVWEVCGHELRSILAGSLQGPSLSVAAQFAPLMRLKVESVGFRTGFNVDEVPVEAGMSGIEWTNEGEDV